MDEKDRSEIRRVERIGHERVGSIGKNSGVADIDAGLPTKLRSETDRMKQRPGVAFIDEIGVVEGIGAVGGVVVGRAVECGIGGVYRA